MNKKFNIAILSNENAKGGAYNMLPSFPQGLLNGLQKQNIESDYILSYFENNKSFDLSISFNVHAHRMWEEILGLNIPHVMWNVDSCFYKNFYITEYHKRKFPNFIIFGVTKSDLEPINHFDPEFNRYIYLPHGTDPEIWKYSQEEKVFDIVYLASIQNPKQLIEIAKSQFPENIAKLFMEMYEVLKENPHKPIWDIYKNMALTKYAMTPNNHMETFQKIFTHLSYAFSYQKRIDLVKSMDDIGVKIWGNPEWKEFITGKNKYMGSADIEETSQILPKSKISLHLQPSQIIDGLHERILNSSLCESAILCDKAPEIYDTFTDSFSYFDIKDFSNAKEKALELLNNEELRQNKVTKAKQLVLAHHTWEERAKAIKTFIR